MAIYPPDLEDNAGGVKLRVAVKKLFCLAFGDAIYCCPITIFFAFIVFILVI